MHELVLAIAVVSISVATVSVYVLGHLPPAQAGWCFLYPAVAGVLAAGILKFTLTGRHLTVAEGSRDLLLAGLLAASARDLPLWHTPQSLAELVSLSPVSAAVFFLVYHGANVIGLVKSKKHPGAIAGAMVALAPFILGLPLALPSDQLAASLGNALGAGLLSHSPALAAGIGRSLLLVTFNVAMAHSFSLATAHRPLARLGTHVTLLLPAIMAVAAPTVADLGSGAFAATLPGALRPLLAVMATALSQGALWAEVFMVTGLVMDSMHSRPPTGIAMRAHALAGLGKGMVFSGVLMALLQLLPLAARTAAVQVLYRVSPVLLFALVGALAFPLAKAAIESFDGSQSFFRRVLASYRRPILVARGVTVGVACALAADLQLPAIPTLSRICFGLVAGALAYAGTSVLRDLVAGLRHRGGVSTWRLYVVEAGLGAFIGGAFAFYFDSAQISVVLDKLELYSAFGLAPLPDDFYPLVSKWGHIQVGTYAGGAKLLFNESLKGVIGWGVAAWLFAINRSFIAALFQRDSAPLRRMFSLGGLGELTEGTIQVLRWGLWMAPIIFTFLKQMSVPTWYNQDGAIHTVFCVFKSALTGTAEFQSWSLTVFMWVLAYDFFRVLIWIDHMGLRVATLVNLSFIGMDRLDERLARFIGPVAATRRCIPEGVKRFTTWAPLLIPFYIPRGADWDWAWSQSEAIQNAGGGGLAVLPGRLSLLQILLACGIAVLAIAAFSVVFRSWRSRLGHEWRRPLRLGNLEYVVTWQSGGEITGLAKGSGYDLTRRAYDGIEPAGRALFLVETSHTGAPESWPVIGNFPADFGPLASGELEEGALILTQATKEIRTSVRISLPGNGPVELWEISVTNLAARSRNLKVVPYLEWVLNTPQADRGHTQYNRLYHQPAYCSGLNALLVEHRETKQFGFLAVQTPPEGYLSARVDFIGRGGTVWQPRALETLAFAEPHDSEPGPNFDAIGSFLLGMSLAPGATARVCLLMGFAADRQQAADAISRHLNIFSGHSTLLERPAPRRLPIGHGEVPPGTPRPYCEFLDGGNVLRVRTPFTPLPFDHTMANALGHVLCVTNRGLHTSANLNSQQNRLTPDWADTVTSELPAEIFYLYDVDSNSWLSPTWLPLRDGAAEYQAEFGLDGTATLSMQRGAISTELTAFVPPDEPAGFYLLTVRNHGETTRKLRFASYFRLALADQPENSGPLEIELDPANAAIYFSNPRNDFRPGIAFSAFSEEPESIETCRGRFLGPGRSIARPEMVERGAAAGAGAPDRSAIASFMLTLEIPPGTARTVSVLLGQAGTRGEAEAVIRQCRTVAAARKNLAATRRWWRDLAGGLRVETDDVEFDRLLNWFKYQALAERIWARKGFYQSSGAFGFRDQLQDAVNLTWVDPALARQQILLHARQQFTEGDVLHWFFLQPDGRTGMGARTHASDNLLWLGWATAEYVRQTGDEWILDERLPYLEAEVPMPPLPEGRHGAGLFPHFSPRMETLADHVTRAIDLVLKKRTGTHGLPLMGVGDWNDGLDNIGCEGLGESVWVGFFLHYVLENFLAITETRMAPGKRQFYRDRLDDLKSAIEGTWRGDRYLRAIHDDGTEIGLKGSGVWEIDAVNAAWAVISGVNPERARVMFDTALGVLERDDIILLGWPPLREDSRPYLGRSGLYPEGVRENGMYCHGVQWLIGAARILAENFERTHDPATAQVYRDTTFRLWRKIAPAVHSSASRMEIYGGQPNKQAADLMTSIAPGRMIWNGYTGAAAWMLRQSCEGVIGAKLSGNRVVLPDDLHLARGGLQVIRVERTL